MRRILPLPLVLLALPIAEIIAFGVVVDWVGFWMALGLVLATSTLGLLIVRHQGFGLIAKVSEIARSGLTPSAGVGGNVVTLFAGLLLMIPGFITDLIGLLLLVPFVRGLFVRSGAPFKTQIFTNGTYTETYAFHRQDKANEGDGIVDLDQNDFHRNPSASRSIDDNRNSGDLH